MSLVLKKVKAGYDQGKKKFSLNHLLFMNDLKLYGKSEDQIGSLVQTVHIVSSDVGVEFGSRKCGILLMKRGEIVRCYGIRLPNGGFLAIIVLCLELLIFNIYDSIY